ncbi:MAG: hypothetical protein ACLS3D_10320 [Roseburia hominis]
MAGFINIAIVAACSARCLSPSTKETEKCQTLLLIFFHHYYGSPIPFFQMAAVFFSSLLRYARPFWANFPVTFYNNRNVRSAKNGRKKNATDFQKNLWRCSLVDIQFSFP